MPIILAIGLILFLISPGEIPVVTAQEHDSTDMFVQADRLFIDHLYVRQEGVRIMEKFDSFYSFPQAKHLKVAMRRGRFKDQRLALIANLQRQRACVIGDLKTVAAHEALTFGSEAFEYNHAAALGQNCFAVIYKEFSLFMYPETLAEKIFRGSIYLNVLSVPIFNVEANIEKSLFGEQRWDRIQAIQDLVKNADDSYRIYWLSREAIVFQPSSDTYVLRRIDDATSYRDFHVCTTEEIKSRKKKHENLILPPDF